MSDTETPLPQGEFTQALEAARADMGHRPTPTQDDAGHTRVGDTPAPAAQRKEPGRRRSRTGSMLMLLNAMWAHLDVADRARDLMVTECSGTGSERRVVEAGTMDGLLTAEAHGAFFRKLAARGYSEATTWDELVEYLPGLCRQAREAYGQRMGEHQMANMVIGAQTLRLAVGAERFLAAAESALYFVEGDDPTEG